jgi:anti-sigma B factor antagonist
VNDYGGQFDGHADLPECVVTEQWRETTVIVSCAGVIDMVTAPHLEQRLAEVVKKEPSALIVDLLGVDFLASHGMNVLALVRRELDPEVKFAVVAEGPATSRPLTLIGLSDAINMWPTLDAALANLDITLAD